uniref:Uncharacterized protein n=1 Tax=Arundo donax TaxID=35708 RepID=A0A0A9GX30_ARUDO
MRPDQGWVGAGKDLCERAGRKKPPPSRTSWPELAWIPGHTGKGQLLTTVRVIGA